MEPSEQTTSETAVEKPTEPVDVNVTLLLRGKQRAYGVHNGEFKRYATYCTTRAQRLRKLLKMDGGPKFDYSPKIQQNAEHLQILLFIADGAWARYRDLKNNAERGKMRAHSIRRLRKSQKWWKLAQECAAEFCTQKTQVEVDAFASYARATLQLEMAKWQEALETYTYVTQIFSTTEKNSNDPTIRSFCRDIIDDIAPLLQFCRFNLGDQDMASVDAKTNEMVREIASLYSNAPTTRVLTELNWRGQITPIVHDGLRQKLASVIDLVEDTRKPNVDPELLKKLYDKIIADSHGCIQLIETIGQKNDSSELKTLNTYLRWNSFIATLERSNALMTELKTPAEKADLAGRTYERIVQVKNQFAGDKSIEALEFTWRSAKVYNLALTFTGGKCIGLLDRARQYCSQAMQIVESENINDPPSLPIWLKTLSHDIRKVKVNIISAQNRPSTKKQQSAFLDDLDNFTPCDELVQIPPQPRIITPKPAIFDNAQDYLDFPSLDAKINKKGLAERLKFW